MGLAAASVGLAGSRRGPGRLSSGPRPGRRQRWPGPRYPPGVQLCGGPAQGAPWTRAAQFATSAWAVAPSRTWAWSRAIGGAGRGIGGAGRLASWTRAAQLAAFAWAEAAVDRAWARRGPGRLSSRRRPGRWLRRGPGHERLHSGAHSLCCCQQAVCRRGLRGGRAKGGAILTESVRLREPDWVDLELEPAGAELPLLVGGPLALVRWQVSPFSIALLRDFHLLLQGTRPSTLGHQGRLFK